MHGGVAAVARLAAVAQSTVTRGVAELDAASELAAGRSRRPGGGRKAATVASPGVGCCAGCPGGSGDPGGPDVCAALDREVHP